MTARAFHARGGARYDVIVPSGKFPIQAPRSIDLTLRVPVGPAGGLPSGGTLYSIQGASNTFSLVCDGAGNTIWKVRGSAASSVPQSLFYLPANGEMQIRGFYDAAPGGEAGIEVVVNGMAQWPFIGFQGGPVGPGIQVPYGITLASNFGADPWAGGPANFFLSLGQPHVSPVREFVWMGDSTTCLNTSLNAAAYSLYTPSQWWTRPGIAGLAANGEVVAGQKLRWQDSVCDPMRGAPGVTAFIYLIGLNNIVLLNDSAATILAALQDLRDTCATDNPLAKHVMGLLTPAHAVLGPAQYATWQAVNAGIPGLVGIDAVTSSYVATLGVGADFLAPAYDFGDGEHPNNAGRAVIAAAFKTSLQGLGLLP